MPTSRNGAAVILSLSIALSIPAGGVPAAPNATDAVIERVAASLQASGEPQAVVVIPGLDPAWAAENFRYGRDQFFSALDPEASGEGFAAQVLRSGPVPAVPAEPDSVWGALRSRLAGESGRWILCGLDEAPPGPDLCLWLSPRLRELEGLKPQAWMNGVLPESAADAMRHVGGVARPLRWDEAAEILALPRGRLEAFRNLPASLEDHPLARLKRVYLGDKLMANSALYALSTCDWTHAALRLGLIEAYRQAAGAVLSGPAAEEPGVVEFRRGFAESGSLVADRTDRILVSLWSEIPRGGSLAILAGREDTTWVQVRRRTR